MKKKGKIALIAVLCVVFCIGVVAGSMAGVASKAIDKQNPDEFLSKWMSYIRDDALLTNVVIAGSHDSGTQDMIWAAKTQDKTIKEQMTCGARYFDIRVQHKYGSMFIFHGPISGELFEPIVDDIKEFLQTNPSETLILDFQHFKGGDVVMNCVDGVLCEKLAGLMVENDTEQSDLDFVKSLTLGDVRGKAIVFWGNEFGTNENSDFVSDKNYLFQRNNDGGTRSGSSLQSFYDGSLNKKSSKTYLEKAIPTYVEKYRQSEGGLFVMQMQLTDPIAIIGPKFYEGTHDKNATSFISTLEGKDYFDCVNIIMRDFLGARKCKQIISLNIAKGTLKDGVKEDFAAMCV